MTCHRIAALISLLIALGSAAASDRPDNVVVVNGSNVPVPVLVTNPARLGASTPTTVFTDVFQRTSATIAANNTAGTRFVARHISMRMASNNSGIALTDANCVVSFRQGTSSFAIASFALQHVDLIGDLSSSRDLYIALSPNDALEAFCVANPANASGRVTVGGDVVPGP